MSSGSSVAPGRLAAFFRGASARAQGPWIAYPAIALFQLKVLWGAWIYRDLTQGDTASYFQRALLWHQFGQVDLIWSPLYTAFYGWFYGITGDVYAATVLHRVLIVVLVTLLVLALFRRLLSPGLAWLAAAWWAVIPFNFDVFEVHLFAILPLVAAPLTVLAWPGPRGRGIALAIMAGAAVLVRNEMAVVAALLAMLFLIWEARYAVRFEEEAPYSPRAYWMAYGVPLALSGALVLFFITRSVIPLPLLRRAYEPKHMINMCQAYAFGYKQRHAEWTKDHWTECSELMLARFGEPYPSLWTMIRQNPRATLGHFAWNLRLLPSGTQLALFGAMSGSISPDYNPVPVSRDRSLLESLILMALIAAGAATRAREGRLPRQSLSSERLIGWLTLAPAAAVVLLLIVPTQRPRPEYLYGLSLPIVAAAAWAADALIQRSRQLDRFGLWMPLAMGALLIVASSYYAPRPPTVPVRPLLEVVRRLEPSQALISDPRTVWAGPFSFSIRGYLLTSSAASYVNTVLRPKAAWLTQRGFAPRFIGPTELGHLGDNQPVEEYLAQRGINVYYLDEATCRTFRSNSLHRRFLDGLGANGWKRLASGFTRENEWALVAKVPSGDSSGTSKAGSPFIEAED